MSLRNITLPDQSSCLKSFYFYKVFMSAKIHSCFHYVLNALLTDAMLVISNVDCFVLLHSAILLTI